MRSDVTRWEGKYRTGNSASHWIPDPLLIDFAHLLGDNGLALDLAAGTCHASIQLAKIGHHVIALDCSLAALQIGQRIATIEDCFIHGLVADIDYWPFPTSTFDVIICLRYLNRKVFPAIEKALQPGGLLIYKTFNQHYLQEVPRFNPEYLLHPGELAWSFPDLELIMCSDGLDSAQPYSFAIAKSPEKT